MKRVSIDSISAITTGKNRRKIKLNASSWFHERGVEVPSFVWQEPPFVLDPIEFVPSAEGLDKRPFPFAVQLESLSRFEDNPLKPHVYVVAGEPTDSKALYFAAYLVQLFLIGNGAVSQVSWERIYGGFHKRNYDARGCDLLVLSNIARTDTNVKLEYVRDLLDIHSDIPRILVVSGEDPVSFSYTRLHSKMTNFFFHSAKLVRRKIEVD